MNVDHCFPWQQALWSFLQNQKQQNALSHAFLFVGMSGVGKGYFAKQFAHSLLCQAPTAFQSACGECHQCQLLTAGNHPDYRVIMPEEAGKAIKIDQIRDLIENIDKTPQISHKKVIIIQPSDAMNVNAANALLKTLEEPTSSTFFILVTDRLMSLPATIRSRCQIIHFQRPKKEEAKAWLKEKLDTQDHLDLLLNLAHGAPLKALELFDNQWLECRQSVFKDFCRFLQGDIDFTVLSSDWAKKETDALISFLTSWICDLISLKQISDFESVMNVDFIPSLKAIAKRYTIQQLYRIYDELLVLQNLQAKKIALNPQLLFEGVLVRFLGEQDHVD